MEEIIQILKGEELSGAETHVYDLSEELIKSGVEVSIINIFDVSNEEPSDRYKERIKFLERAGADVYALEAQNKLDLSTVGKIKDIVAQADPAVVHTHMPYADLFGGVAAKISGNCPVVSTRHHDYLTSWKDWLRFVPYYAVAGNFLDALISVSEQVASQAKEYESWSESDVHVVHHGCRNGRIPSESSRREVCSALGIRKSSVIVLSVGRLLRWKGHKYAVRALRHLRSETEEIHWLIAGDGPQRDSLHSLASELGVSTSLYLLGHRDDVPTLMSAADVLVHPSTSEAFGIVLIEAMMQGTPVVASSAGAIPEIVVHDETGYLVEPADSEAISEAIHRLLESSDKRKEMGESARQSYLQNYTIEKMARNTLRVYNRYTKR
jgi:Glycosyltransferase